MMYVTDALLVTRFVVHAERRNVSHEFAGQGVIQLLSWLFSHLLFSPKLSVLVHRKPTKSVIALVAENVDCVGRFWELRNLH